MLEKKRKSDYKIPLQLQGKRLEELSWDDVRHILP